MTALPSQIGPYRIVRLIGEGGMGSVYEARQAVLDRRVALKTLHAEYARNQDAIARFFNEAKVLSRLEHPSIVQVFDFGHTSDGTAYLVMEYLRGESLAHRLRSLAQRDERLPTVTAVQVAWQVADVLAVAHAQGIVHRDLKPDNLMLVADPIAPGGERVKLLDFGIAKLTRAGDRGALKTDTQAVMGTPMYMSPEQCAGAGGVDDKTDVYSLGCVLYEMLGGRPPFVAEGAGQLVGMHLFREPPQLISVAPKVPAKIAELSHLLLTKDKAHRPSMSEACDELGLVLSKLSGGGPVVRSRLPASTDPDATHAIPVVRALSTLGQSIGQWGAAAPWRLRLFFASAAILLLAGLFVTLLLRSGQKTAPAIPLPPALPAEAATPSRSEKPEPVIVPQEAAKSPVKQPAPPPQLPAVKAGSHKPTPRPASSSPIPNRPKASKAHESMYVD